MLTQNVFESGARHCLPAGIREQFRNVDFTSDRQPRSDRRCRFFPQRQATFFSAFAVDQDAGLWLKNHVLNSEAHQLGNPHPTSETKMEHSSVTDTVPMSRIGSVQDRLHLLGRQVPDKPGIRLLRGDGQNALDLLQGRWDTIFHVAHEGFDGRQPDVPGTSAIATGCFEVI
jgi:hypothetical protein